MDIMQLPLVRKIGDLFRRSILLLHFSWISRIAQLLQVIISLSCTLTFIHQCFSYASLGAPSRSQRYILLLSVRVLDLHTFQAVSDTEEKIEEKTEEKTVEKTEEKKDAAVPEKTNESDITFILPDLISQCKFPLRYHPQGDEVAKESAEWLDARCPRLNLRQRDAMYGLQGGVLAAYSYTTGPKDRLRVIADYINYLFHL